MLLLRKLPFQCTALPWLGSAASAAPSSQQGWSEFLVCTAAAVYLSGDFPINELADRWLHLHCSLESRNQQRQSITSSILNTIEKHVVFVKKVGFLQISIDGGILAAHCVTLPWQLQMREMRGYWTSCWMPYPRPGMSMSKNGQLHEKC